LRGEQSAWRGRRLAVDKNGRAIDRDPRVGAAQGDLHQEIERPAAVASLERDAEVDAVEMIERMELVPHVDRGIVTPVAVGRRRGQLRIDHERLGQSQVAIANEKV